MFITACGYATRYKFGSHKSVPETAVFWQAKGSATKLTKTGAQYIMASSEYTANEPRQFKANAQPVNWTVQVGGNVSVRQRGWCSKAEDWLKEWLWAIALLSNSLDVLVDRLQSFLSTRLRPVT